MGILLLGAAPSVTAIPAQGNLVARFSADAITPQTDNTTLTSWTDSVNGIVAGTTVGTGPKYRTGILNSKPSVRTSGGGLSIATPGAIRTAIDSQQSSTFIVYKRTSGASTGGVDCLWGATAGGGSYFYTADGVNVGRYGVLLPVATAVQNAFSTLGGTCNTSVPGDGVGSGYETVCVNGGVSFNQNLPGPLSGGQTFCIGSNNANNFPSSADIFEILIWNRALTPIEYMQAQKWACEKYAQPYPWAGMSQFFVFFGDSITQGGGSAPPNGFPNVAAASLSLPFGTWHNLGVGGLTLPSMGTIATSYICPMAALIGSTKLVVVAHEWANARSAGDTSQGATYLAAIKSVANTLNVWGTSTSASSYDPSSARAAYNAAWDAAHTTNIDAYWPIHTDTHIGVDGSYATYNSGGDGTHPTDDGNAHLASTAVTAIGLLPATVTRILLACYGQSNMVNMFVINDGSTPSASAGTYYYNGSIITSPPNASGIRTLMNAVKAVTGLDVLALSAAAGATSMSGLVKGTGNYTSLLTQTLAVLQSGDAVFMPWDQGEGDADESPNQPIGKYMRLLGQLQLDFATDIGRACPMLVGALGNGNPGRGTILGGSNNFSWHNIQAQHLLAPQFYPGVIYSHSNIDAARSTGDGYHYVAAHQAKQGNRFARAVTTLRGATSGYAHWEITSAATVDATHTNVNLTHALGSDFTPTSGIQGFEVSGDNGATWVTPSAAVRSTATQISLTHASLSTTSTRLVRYQYGLDLAGLSGAPDGPPANLVADNSALVVPLTPTADDVRPTPLSVVPVPTWRDAQAAATSNTPQNIPTLQLGLTNERKFVVLSVIVGLVPSTVTLTPSVGSAVAATLVKTQGIVSIFKALLGSDANAAKTFALDLTYGGNPFGGAMVEVWTVPHADMTSTTETGTGGAGTTGTTAVSATVNTSAGGFVIASLRSTAGYTAMPSTAGSANVYAIRALSTGISKLTLDASNVAASAVSGLTVTVNVAGDLTLALAAWR